MVASSCFALATQRFIRRMNTECKSVWRGLAGGAARSADWRYLAEIAIAKEKQHAADAD